MYIVYYCHQQKRQISKILINSKKNRQIAINDMNELSIKNA